jgi:hypothetical protein
MATVFLSPLGGSGAQFFTDNGLPLSGGKLYTYAAGTSMPQVTYTSYSGSTPQTNPIILNSAGRVPNGEIWLTSAAYKFLLNDSTDVLIATYDNISGINAGVGAVPFNVQNFTGDGSTTVFTLNSSSLGINYTLVYINGVYQQKNSYTILGTFLTFSEAPPLTSTVEIMYN